MKKILLVTCLIIASNLFTGCQTVKEQIVKEEPEKSKKISQPIKKEPEEPKKTNLDYLYDAFEYVIRHSTLKDYSIHISSNDQREALKIITPIISEKEKYRMEKAINSEFDDITYELKNMIKEEREKLPFNPDYKHESISKYKGALNILNEREKKNKKISYNDCTDVLVYLLRKGEDIDTVFNSYGLYELRNNPKEFRYDIDDYLEFWEKEN